MLKHIMTNSSKHYNTIVIGAGISGLGCASRLLEHEFYQQPNRLLVLEARDRIGGRINSVHINGVRCDTGANWIHGVGTPEAPNPLLQILPNKRSKEISGRVVFKKPVTRDDSSIHDSRTEGESLVIPAKFAAPISNGIWDVIGGLHGRAAELSPEEAKSTSIVSALVQTEEFKETYESVAEEYRDTFGGLLQFIENMEAGPLTESQAKNKREHSTMSMLEYAIEDFDGEQLFLLDGYTPIVEEVARDLVRRKLVRTGVNVDKVSWESGLIILETSDGTHSADNVICTLPLGVLQYSLRESQSIFQPKLPYEDSIRALGFGTLDKIFMIYESAWWEIEPFASILKNGNVDRHLDDSSETKSLLPDSLTGFTMELPGISISSTGEVSPGPQSLFLMNLSNLTGVPALMAFASCSTATIFEAKSDEEAGALIQRALSSWFARETPPPKAVHVTRWAQDPFSRGSYTHMVTGSSETRHREAFAETLTNAEGATLSFAGEHTSRNHFATVHGALLSGWREADKLIARVACTAAK